MTTVPTAGLEFRITGDASGYRAALQEAQKAHQQTAKTMADQFGVAVSVAREAIEQFVERAKEAAVAAGIAVAASAGQIGGALVSNAEAAEKAVAKGFDGMNASVDAVVNNMLAKAGPWGRALAVAWNAGLKNAAFAGLDALKPQLAGKLDDIMGSDAVAKISANASRTWANLTGAAAGGIRAGANLMGIDPQTLAQSETLISQWADAIRKKVNELAEGVRTALQKLAGTFTGVSDEVKQALEKIDKTLDRQEFQTGQLGRGAGDAASRRIEFEFLTALEKTIDDLTEAEKRELSVRQERAATAATEEESRRREIQDGRQYTQTVESLVTSLRRQVEMERVAANAILQTAGARARARAEAMVAGSRRGNDPDLAQNPQVQAALLASEQGGAQSAIDRVNNAATESLRRQTDAQLLAQRAIGATAGEAARYAYVAEQVNNAHREGVPVTAEMRAAYEGMGREIERHVERTVRMNEQLRVLQDIGRTVANSMEQAFSRFMDGTKFKFSDFVKSLQADLAKLAFREGVMGLLGGGSKGNNPTGLIGSLLGSMFGGFKAEGGPVSGGTPYVVGEKGPELFVPRGSGTVVANGAMGGGGNTTIRMVVDLTGANGDETIARISRQAAMQAAAAAVQQANDAFPARQRKLQQLGA